MKVEVFQSEINGDWYIRSRYSSNGLIHMVSEGYKSLRSVARALKPLYQAGWEIRFIHGRNDRRRIGQMHFNGERVLDTRKGRAKARRPA